MSSTTSITKDFMQRAEELMQSIADQIPGAKVSPTNGAPIVVIDREHPNGKHSVVWYNYPRENPLVLKVFSHHGDFAAPSSQRRQYQVKSVEAVVSLVEVLYRRTSPPAPGDRIRSIIARYAFPGSSLEDQITELLADVIEFADAKELVFEDLLAKAEELFTDEEPQESTHV